jgi:hypothetical protein
MYLWRAVDDEGEVLDLLVRSKCSMNATLRLMRKLLKRQGLAPTASSLTGIAPTRSDRNTPPIGGWSHGHGDPSLSEGGFASDIGTL